jgi:plastocyanin
MSTITNAVATRDTTAGASAHRLVVVSSLGAVAADAVLMTVIGGIIPPLTVFALLTLGTVAATRRRPRAGAVALAVLALAANAGGLAFLLADLATPADTIAFLWAVVSGGGRVMVVIGAVFVLTTREVAARRLAATSLVVLGVAVAGSLGARLSVSSDAPQAGDVEVVAAGAAFPDHVVVPVGGAVLVDNRDPLRHTFAIEGTGLDVLVEPRVQRRIEIDVPPGTYTFVCTVPGHESMTGTLEVR